MWGGVSQEGTENQVFKLLLLQANLWAKSFTECIINSQNCALLLYISVCH